MKNHTKKLYNTDTLALLFCMIKTQNGKNDELAHWGVGGGESLAWGQYFPESSYGLNFKIAISI